MAFIMCYLSCTNNQHICSSFVYHMKVGSSYTYLATCICQRYGSCILITRSLSSLFLIPQCTIFFSWYICDSFILLDLLFARWGWRKQRLLLDYGMYSSFESKVYLYQLRNSSCKEPFLLQGISTFFFSWIALKMHCNWVIINYLITFISFFLAFLKWNERIWSEACDS